MAERAHPEDKGFKGRFFGLRKSSYRQALYGRYRFCNKYITNKLVLDVPCGTGWGTSLLTGYNNVYGLDISGEAIEYAKTHFPGVFVVGDMTDMPFDESFFDVVICLEGFEHVTFLEGQAFLRETKRVLKEAGRLIMTVPLLTDRKHSGNKYHLCEYYEPELIEILENEFEMESYEKIQGPDSLIARCVLVHSSE